MDLSGQSNVSAFQYTVYVCQSVPADNKSSSDFMTAVTICSDFGAQEKEICHYFRPFPFYLPCGNAARMEKAMATHSSVLAWRIPGMAEPGGLPSMGSPRVGHDWSDLAAMGPEAMILDF